MSRTDRSAQNISLLRESFRREYLDNQDLYYEEDYQKLESDDWYVKRFFLARNRNENEALKMIIETMRWRKSIKIREFCDYHFPIEFYKIGALFIYECDRDGYLTVYIRVKMHRKIPELDDHSKKFLIHVLNKADIMTGGNGIGVVFDVTGAGYRNLDWDYLKFLINSGSSYFPVGVKYILVVNVPWALNAFRRIALSFLPASWFGLIKFANGDEVFNYIDKTAVPDYLGGTCKRNFRAIPPGSRPVSQVITEFGYSLEDIDRILPEFADSLDEATLALETKDYVNPSPDFWDSLEDEDVKEDENMVHSKKSVNYLLVNPSVNMMFRYDYCDHAYIATLVMSNPMETPVAFKIQSTSPSKYTVSPSLGIILPKRTISITVKFNQASAGGEMLKDKFLILGLAIDQTWLTVEDFYHLWIKRRDEIYSHKLSPLLDEDDDNTSEETVEPYGNNKLYKRKLNQPQRGIINGGLKLNSNQELDQQMNRLTERIDSLATQQKKTWFFLTIIMSLYFLILSYYVFDIVHLLQEY